MRSLLRRDLKAAIAARDRPAVSALRSALAAIDNAQAPPIDSATAAIGVGSTEVDRLELTDDDLADVLRAEIAEYVGAAEQYESIGRHDDAARLRGQGDVLRKYLRDESS